VVRQRLGSAVIPPKIHRMDDASSNPLRYSDPMAKDKKDAKKDDKKDKGKDKKKDKKKGKK
jgi:hypothetical protein